MRVFKRNSRVNEAAVYGPADDNIAWNIELIDQNNNPYARQIWDLIQSLLKKDARGQEIKSDTLLNSSFLDSLVRNIVREMQREYNDEGDFDHISTATKKLAKKNITDYIMRRFEDEKFFRDNKTESRKVNEGSILLGDDVYEQTKFILNKALHKVMGLHQSKYKVEDLEIYADSDDWIEGKGGTIDFIVSYINKNPDYVAQLEISFNPYFDMDKSGSFTCYYTVVLPDNTRVHVKPLRIKRNFTKDYLPTKDTPYTYLSGLFYDDMVDCIGEAIDTLESHLAEKGVK